MRISSRWFVVLATLRKLSSFFGILLRPRQFILALNARFNNAEHRLASQWQGLTRFQRHVLTNLLIGLGIAIGLSVFHSSKILRDLEDGGIDWAMRLYRGTSSSVMNVPMVLFDIDEQTYQKWGEPVSTPRDKLLKLITLAVDNQAAVAIVDIDVSRRLADTNADNVLRDYLAEFSVCGEESKQPIDPQFLAGRIVLIGNSTRDNRDLYQTPLGEIMPGVVILSNAIHSLMEHGQFRPPSLALKLVIEALLILIMSVLFARFNSFWGMFISGLTIVAALIPLSVWMFGQGLWIDFAIPLLAVELHEMAAEFEASVRQKKELEHES